MHKLHKIILLLACILPTTILPVSLAGIESFNVPHLTQGEISGVNAARQYDAQLRAQQLENQIAMQRLRQIQLESEQLTQDNQDTNSHLRIMIFAKTRYPTYLGCMNCAEYVKDSISNVGGPYGSKDARKSIFYKRGLYGSLTSDLSACNPHALHPPFIIDSNGKIYGLLTLNLKLPGVTKNPLMLYWLKTYVCSS
jgi:hypothetical protein